MSFEDERDPFTKSDVTRYGTGCTRSSDADAYAYDIIPACAERREAARWRMGELKHGRGNWKQGQPIKVIVNHISAHWNAYRSALERGDAVAVSQAEDHLAAMRCGLAMLMHYEETAPELFAPGEWDR